ncbi:MAG: hypothetical protein ACI4A5_10920 [Hominilimicola sp.]
MSYVNIKRDLDAFHASVKRLGYGVGKASALWKDEKYTELSNSIRNIASMSKDVIIAGNRCHDSISRFDSIANEKH